MSVDACVYCNCWEAGTLRVQPDPAWALYVDACGIVESASEDPEILDAVEQWREVACEHERGIHTHAYLGNIARIERLVAELSPFQELFPLILGRVLYNATHAGDFLTVEAVDAVAKEIPRLSVVLSPAVTELQRELRTLTEAALALKKPISF